MPRFFTMLIALLALTVFVASCNYNVDKRGTPEGQNPLSKPTLDFETVKATVILKNCFSCHQAPRNAGGLNLETYENVVAQLASIENAVATRYMPESKGRVMPDNERQLLLSWIRAGAPRTAEASGSNPGGVVPAPQPNPSPSATPNRPDDNDDDDDHGDHHDDDHDRDGEDGSGGGTVEAPLEFPVLLQTVIRPNCFGCHTAARAAGGVSLETADALLSNASAVRHAVESGSMPLGRVMSAEHKAQLFRWLDANGASVNVIAVGN